MGHQQEVEIRCPYCGERVGILVDCSIEEQQYVEDCQVCCQPIEMSVKCSHGLAPSVTARHQDEV